ncbi:diguanylate cyclase domain-containing protein [Trichlorobacter ammonificans]|uniref:diguanylate cyclase n=1 Tax=Trichlorobacter ammonificans TaxID=2916410 RepID=A0ABN8HLX7_9BACT|nr:diguanylate cyclase [Trichlorobacter ammonificans]CAH2032372.1 Response regulator receiver modulated diguanylate cyclase [Trichlorobacter ammonificans]
MHGLRPTLLIIDDTPINIRVLSELFADECEILFATSGEDGLRLAASDRPDLILLDIMMPRMDGYEVCRRLKSDPQTRDIPVVFVTALGEEKDETQGLELGAIDYIIKPINPPIVKARIRNHLELKRHRDLLSAMATIDGLTGIANRRRFDEMLRQEWHRAQRSGTPLSVLMIDIDHFKLYNDRYGHLAGDDCLKAVACCMLGVIRRPGDLLARYGGEEFACILSETDVQGARKVAEHLHQAVAALEIPHADSPVSPIITVSIGFCTTWPNGIRNSQELVDCADRNLYRAKHEGRNRVYFCGPDDCDLSCCILETNE